MKVRDPGRSPQPTVDIATTIDENGKTVFGSGGGSPELASGPELGTAPGRCATETSSSRLPSAYDEIAARLRWV